MAYWRMQLHPDRPGQAIRRSTESLAAGYIGLDFDQDVGDMMSVPQGNLPDNQRDYWTFAHEMRVGDVVLVMAHHFPLALATISGDYNHIKRKAPELKIWFRHFRSVRDVRYYGDFKTNANEWQRIVMTDTISPLRDTGSESYRLIEAWMRDS